MMSTAILGPNCHGKGVIRVVKVVRNGDRHTLLQLSVTVLLEGKNDIVFVNGDNSPVVPTDTCKNTVYLLCKQHNFKSIEELSVIICRHFLAEYPDRVTRVKVDIEESLWERVLNTDSRGRPAQEHNHSFVKPLLFTPFCRAVAHRGSSPSSPMDLTLSGGIKNLTIAKTTKSSFTGFHVDRFTSLPQEGERIMSTTVEAEWTYHTPSLSPSFNFREVMERCAAIFVDAFSGPADIGVMSDSVQQTLFQMGQGVINEIPEVDRVRLYLPNNHNFPYPLEDKVGVPNQDHEGKTSIFFPTADPYGIIEATILRKGSRL